MTNIIIDTKKHDCTCQKEHCVCQKIIITYNKKLSCYTYPCIIELMIGTKIAGRAKLSTIDQYDEINVKERTLIDLKKTMKLSHIYVDEKYRGQNFSRILLCNILEVAKIRFSAEWIILYCIPLYRDDAKWLKQYYEKLGFVDIGFKNLMYANINLILPNILRETPNF